MELSSVEAKAMKYRMGCVGACAILVAGMVVSERATAEPPLKAPPPEKMVEFQAPVDSAGALQGIILENDRPQPYLGVVLLGPNGSEMGATRSDERGVFLFQAVNPGIYVLSTKKTESSGPAVGSLKVTVQPGRVQNVTLRLVKSPVP
jgi:hypothetical protein